MIDKREKARLRAAEWRARNPEKAKEISRRANAKKRAENPEVIRAYNQAYREKNRQALCDAERERKFGISRQEYAELFHSQNGTCAICCQPETATRMGKIKALAVDHSHVTGKVRGLLCSDCNMGIGKLKDDRNIILNAVKYLDTHSEQSPNVVSLTSKG